MISKPIIDLFQGELQTRRTPAAPALGAKPPTGNEKDAPDPDRGSALSPRLATAVAGSRPRPHGKLRHGATHHLSRPPPPR